MDGWIQNYESALEKTILGRKHAEETVRLADIYSQVVIARLFHVCLVKPQICTHAEHNGIMLKSHQLAASFHLAFPKNIVA